MRTLLLVFGAVIALAQNPVQNGAQPPAAGAANSDAPPIEQLKAKMEKEKAEYEDARKAYEAALQQTADQATYHVTLRDLADLPVLRVEPSVGFSGTCSIPLLPVPIPTDRTFTLQQAAPDLKRLAPMPQGQGPAPPCGSMQLKDLKEFPFFNQSGAPAFKIDRLPEVPLPPPNPVDKR